MPDYRDPHTREQALVEALYLRLKAAGESQARACDLLIQEFAYGLDDRTLDAAKAYALERFELEGDRVIRKRRF